MPISEWVKTLRERVGTALVVMVASSAIVVDERGKVLLQQRSDNGQWGIPGGGIDPGEEPAHAVIREVYEETGLDVEVSRLVGLFGGKQQIKQYPNGDRIAYVSITFECRVTGGEIKPDPDESLDVRWFALDELPPEFMSVHQRRINAWQSGEIPIFDVMEIDVNHLSKSNYMADIRRKAGNLPVMSPGATGLVFDDAGRVLVQKRRDDKLWNLPGGLYEPGEEPADIVIREVYEETGLLVSPVRLIGVYGGADYVHTYPNGDRVSYVNIVFLCDITGGTLNANNHETDELCFVDPRHLPEPFTDKHRLLIDHALNRTEPFFVR